MRKTPNLAPKEQCRSKWILATTFSHVGFRQDATLSGPQSLILVSGDFSLSDLVHFVDRTAIANKFFV